jgi:GMP synthase (glutamine-hydrolysing)
MSGGVDSSVMAAILDKAVGEQLICVYVNNGLMRKGESQQVADVFGAMLGNRFIAIDATERFLNKLLHVSDPEEKRKIIGNEFIRIFEEEAKKLDGIRFLAQGTIYPDVSSPTTMWAGCPTT